MIRSSWRRREVLLLAAAATAASWSRGAAQPAASGKKLTVVDAQVHIWGGGKPTPVQRQEPFSKDQLLQEMNAAGVSRAILVPPSWDPAGNAVSLAAAKEHPDRFAVMGLIDLGHPDAALVQNWKKQPGMLGVRLFLASPQAAAPLSDGTADWFWPAAERADIAVMMHAGGLLPAIGRIAERHPRLRICIDSLGAPLRSTNEAAFAERHPRLRICINSLGAPLRSTNEAAFADLPSLLALAKLANVSVKAEGLPSLSTEPHPYKNLHAHLRRIYDAFGPQRLFWGSDLTRMKVPYQQVVAAVTEGLPWLGDRDRELIMGRAVADWIGWPLPT